MADANASSSNAWVDSYLNALLTFGLSSEYSAATKESAKEGVIDADRSLYSRYYVQQLLRLDEKSLQNAWSKATSATRQGGHKDARLQYLSWRIWHMRRKHEEVLARRAAEAQEDEDALLPYYSDDDEDVRSPVTKPPSRPGGAVVQAVAAPPAAPEGAKAEAPEGAPALPEVAPGPPGLVVSTDPSAAARMDTGARAEPTLCSVFEGYILSPGEQTPHAFGVGRLYVVMISLHGLIRGQHMELGKDSDTGGQVKYVVELAKAMALHPAVYRVDLLTRLIRDPRVDPEYGVEEECLSKGPGDLGGAYIVRLPCGPTHMYIRKELLWPFVREFADRGIAHVTHMLASLADAGHRCELYAIHGHYADAGEAAVLMSNTLNASMVMTGHSLGRNKLEHLLATGSMTRAEIEATYAISRRIEAEERCLDHAVMVFTSTQQEIQEQWGLYDGYSPNLARVLHFRRSSGRHMPLMKVSAPGLDFSSMKVDMPEDPVLKEFENQRAAMVDYMPISPRSTPRPSDPLSPGASGAASSAPAAAAATASPGGESPSLASPKQLAADMPTPLAAADVSLGGDLQPRIWQDISRFLRNPFKPAVLAMSRPDAKKNITTLVKAFGEHTMLRELANLVLVMGNRDNVDSMAAGSQKVMLQVLKLVDAHDLYGSVAYPKHHTQADISDIYMFAHATRGVFTNIALQEPFGLTIIEAAAHGVPTVATQNGGPVDILATLSHGVLVDPTDSDAVAAALLKILTNPELWDQMSASARNNVLAYSWPAHVKRYVEALEAEERFIKLCRKQDRTLSGLLEKRVLSPSAVAEGEPDASAPSKTTENLALERYFSTPEPPMASVGSGTGPRKTISGISTDDMAVLQSLSETLLRTGDAMAGCNRHQLAVFAIDSNYCIEEVATATRAFQAELAGWDKDGTVGLGILSMLGFDSTTEHLQAAGVDMHGVDFMVCNAGADIWHRHTDSHWDADEQYEGLIEYEWERISLHRMLEKIISQTSEDHKRLPRLKELLYNVGEQTETGVHPRHICLELDVATQAILSSGMGPRARDISSADLSSAVVDRLRRRLRSKGVRASYTLQQVPRDGGFLAVLHITPVRASRALALRHVASKYGLDMSAVSVAVLAPDVQGSPPDVVAGSFTSDTPDLLAGWQKAVVLTPGNHDSAGLPYGGMLLNSMGVRLRPWLADGDRLRLASLEAAADAILEALKQPAASEAPEPEASEPPALLADT